MSVAVVIPAEDAVHQKSKPTSRVSTFDLQTTEQEERRSNQTFCTASPLLGRRILRCCVMASKGANALLSRASRIRAKLQGLEASSLVVEDVSYQHAGHTAVKDGAEETHFNVKIVSEKFSGQSLVKRHQMIYGLLNDEMQSGLHALSIVAKTPQEAVPK